MEIKINCKGADTLPIAELKDFQGELKTITPENLDKLKRSIKKHGFTAPIFVWDNNGVKNILDGHQRLKALVDMQGEGAHVPELPVVYIYADNEKDAKEKLLYITSQYGDFTTEGYKEFTFDMVQDLTDLRLLGNEFTFEDPFELPDDNKDIDEESFEDTKNECPKCGFRW